MRVRNARRLSVAIGAATAALAGGASATPLLHEQFNHPTTASTPTRGLSGTVGNTFNTGGYTAPNGNAWFPTSTAFDGGPGNTGTYNVANDAAVVAGSLGGNASLALLDPAPSGNSISYGGPGYTPKIGFTEIETGTVYYSVAVNLTDISITNPAFGTMGSIGGFALGGEAPAEGGNPSRQPVGIFIRGTGTNDALGNPQFNLGVSKSETNPNTSGANPNGTVFGTGVYSQGQTLFLVGKYQFIDDPNNPDGDPNNDNDNVATLYVNPTPGGAEGLGALETIVDSQGVDLLSGNAALDGIDSFIFREGGNPTAVQGTPNGVLADELRVGTTWGDVTPVPEPASLVALGLAGAGVLVRRRRQA